MHVLAAAVAWLQTISAFHLPVGGPLAVKAGGTIRFQPEYIHPGQRQASRALCDTRVARGTGVARESRGTMSKSAAGKLGGNASSAKRQRRAELEVSQITPLTSYFDRRPSLKPSLRGARRTEQAVGPSKFYDIKSYFAFTPLAAAHIPQPLPPSSDVHVDSEPDHVSDCNQSHSATAAPLTSQSASTSQSALRRVKRARPSKATLPPAIIPAAKKSGQRGVDKQPRAKRRPETQKRASKAATPMVKDRGHCVFHCLVCGKQSLQKNSLAYHVSACTKFGDAYVRLVGMFARMEKEAFVRDAVKERIAAAGVCLDARL